MKKTLLLILFLGLLSPLLAQRSRSLLLPTSTTP